MVGKENDMIVKAEVRFVDIMMETIISAESAWKAGYLTWDEYKTFVSTIQTVNSYENHKRINNEN